MIVARRKVAMARVLYREGPKIFVQGCVKFFAAGQGIAQPRALVIFVLARCAVNLISYWIPRHGYPPWLRWRALYYPDLQ